MKRTTPRHGIRRPALVQAAAALTGLSLVLAGCSGGDDAEAQDESGPVTLSVAVWNYEGTPEFKALFDAFEEANPDVTIEPVDILAEDYADKLTTMLAGGDSTDVLTIKNPTDYARYGGRGQLLDVTDVVDGMDTSTLAGLEVFDMDGVYYSVPYRQDFWLLYYNKGIFDAAGVDYPVDLTWDEYAETAKELTSTTDGTTTYGTYQHTWRSVVQALAAAQTGGDLLSGDYAFMQDQYDMSLDLQSAGATLDWATASAQQTSYRTMFETGAAAMLPMGSWYIAGILKAVDEGSSTVDWGVARMPQATAGADTTIGLPTAFAVNKKAAHPETAKKFLEFAAGEAGAKAVAGIGVTPAFSGPAVSEVYSSLDGLPTDADSTAALVPGTIVLEIPVSDYTSDVDTILTEEHSLIMVGEKPVTEGIAQMGQRVQNEVLD